MIGVRRGRQNQLAGQNHTEHFSLLETKDSDKTVCTTVTQYVALHKGVLLYESSALDMVFF
jgi:hypothetical protein